MPYVTPYPTNLPDLDEARLFALQAMIVASLADLNAALQRDALAGGLAIAQAQVVIGDAEQVTTSRICIVGGGKHDATDMEMDTKNGFIPRGDKQGYVHTIYTNIYCYIGPDDLPLSDPDLYTQLREVALSRICGHLRKRVFNSQQGVLIQLTSQEFTSDPDFDQLKDAHISKITKGMAQKGPAGFEEVWSANLLHQGWIA